VETSDCSGDDDLVNVSDLLLLLSGWGHDATGVDLVEPPDIVNTDDLLELIVRFGACGNRSIVPPARGGAEFSAVRSG